MKQFLTCDVIMDSVSEIKKGDIVYLVSDILELSKTARENGEHFDSDVFLDSLISKIGESGTLLIPTFNWSFCKGDMFDYHRTPSKTGALGNRALKRPDFTRTKHPLYSFAVWGNEKEYLAEIDPKASFGEGTIFDFLYKKKAKALVISLPPLAGLTFIHHIEKMVGVPYRYEKDFTASYKASDGIVSEKTYSMYVRDLDMDPRHINRFALLGSEMQEKGLIHSVTLNGVDFHVISLEDVYSIVENDITQNDSRKMYVYKGQAV